MLRMADMKKAAPYDFYVEDIGLFAYTQSPTRCGVRQTEIHIEGYYELANPKGLLFRKIKMPAKCIIPEAIFEKFGYKANEFMDIIQDRTITVTCYEPDMQGYPTKVSLFFKAY